MKQGERTRNTIIQAANKLFYQQGFHKTAFSDIVKEVGLSKGNITYHFKSKEDILTAVFELRIKEVSHILSSWDKESPNIKTRLLFFINSLIDNKSKLTRYGCPHATLASELGKSNALTRELSKRIFNLIQHWLTEQFLALGYSAEQSTDRALELFTRGQGICLLAQVYDDEEIFETQIKHLKELITKEDD